MKFLSSIRVLLIGLWLGAAFFFSFSVAPGAFGVLRDQQVAHFSAIAGELVSRNLMIVNLSGLIIGIIALATSFIGAQTANRFALLTERITLSLLTLACAVGQFVIALWLRFVKTEMGKPIDEFAVDDLLRIKFNNLHEYSVWVLVVGMIAALVAFFIIAGRNSAVAAPKTSSTNFDFDKEFKV